MKRFTSRRLVSKTFLKFPYNLTHVRYYGLNTEIHEQNVARWHKQIDSDREWKESMIEIEREIKKNSMMQEQSRIRSVLWKINSKKYLNDYDKKIFKDTLHVFRQDPEFDEFIIIPLADEWQRLNCIKNKLSPNVPGKITKDLNEIDKKLDLARNIKIDYSKY